MVFRLISLLFFLTLSGCSKAPNISEHRLLVFGTYLDISIFAAQPQQEREAIVELTQQFQQMHQRWHAWDEGSALVAINRDLAAGIPAKVPEDLQPLLKESIHLANLSEGLFNPTIGNLLKMWGFQQSERPHQPPPASTKLDAWLRQRPTVDQITLNEGLITSTNSNVQFDLGAIGKGYAVDLAIATLRQHGIENAIVNAGGDLRAIGSKDGKPWVVGIRHPQGSGVLAAIEVRGDESVFTSGNYERYNEYEGVRYTHILDPRSAMPVSGITSVTVIHPNGTLADAAATALVVAGASDWYRIAKKMGIKYTMLVEESGRVHLSPSMLERIDLDPSSSNDLQLSAPL